MGVAQQVILPLLFALIACLLLFYFRFASLRGSVVDISGNVGSSDKVIATTVALVFHCTLKSPLPGFLRCGYSS